MKNQFFLSVLIIISFSLNVQIATARSQSNISYQSLKDTILALEHTRTKSQKKIKRLSSNPPSVYNKKQLNEFTVFYEYLSYQINEYCKQIRTDYGQNKVEDLPCDSFYTMLSSENYSEQKELKTTSEQVNELEDEFMVSMGNFDEMLLKEEQEISQTIRKKNKSSASQTNENSKGNMSSYKGGEASDKNNTGGKQTSESSRKQGKNKAQSTAQQAREKQNRGKGYGMGKSHKNQSGNNDKTSDREKRKLDEINDDIVARQLKEAAEKEIDPQLKERLWQEYYRYKKGLKK